MLDSLAPPGTIEILPRISLVSKSKLKFEASIASSKFSILINELIFISSKVLSKLRSFFFSTVTAKL